MGRYAANTLVLEPGSALSRLLPHHHRDDNTSPKDSSSMLCPQCALHYGTGSLIRGTKTLQPKAPTTQIWPIKPCPSHLSEGAWGSLIRGTKTLQPKAPTTSPPKILRPHTKLSFRRF